MVGTENLNVPNPHKRVWFRNVFTEPVGSLGQCEDPAAPLTTKATECVALPATVCAGSGSSGSGSASKTSGLLVAALVVLAAACIVV